MVWVVADLVVDALLTVLTSIGLALVAAYTLVDSGIKHTSAGINAADISTRGKVCAPSLEVWVDGVID